MGNRPQGLGLFYWFYFLFDWRRVAAAMSYFVDHFVLSKLCLYLLSMPGKKVKPVICSSSATLSAAFIKVPLKAWLSNLKAMV